ncbi:Uncharacterised protein [Mycobacteroides abscessus]|nr:Uncharacterised protein [Mycobacteroides abscessus]
MKSFCQYVNASTIPGSVHDASPDSACWTRPGSTLLAIWRKTTLRSHESLAGSRNGAAEPPPSASTALSSSAHVAGGSTPASSRRSELAQRFTVCTRSGSA